MAAAADVTVLEAGLDVVATSTRQTVCSAQPANFAGIEAVALVETTIDGGDFAKGAGDVDGRKITVAQQADRPIDASGEANHIAYDDGTTLLYVTTCTPQALTEAGTVTIPAHKLENGDPATV